VAFLPSSGLFDLNGDANSRKMKSKNDRGGGLRAIGHQRLACWEVKQMQLGSQSLRDRSPDGAVDSTWADYYWYHCIDLGKGVITDGDYDMNEYLDEYQFPEDLTGQELLDVGRASGFFSFEFERRGANVTATDVASMSDWDFVGGEPEKLRQLATIEDHEAFTRRYVTGAFHFAHAARRSKVKAQTMNVYQIGPERFGNKLFDLVFAGSITSHLRDPMLALEKIRSVTAGKCIVAAPCINIAPDFAVMAMVGLSGTDRRNWWVFNKKGLEGMLLRAGFSKVEIVSEFQLRHRKSNESYDHLVAHAWP